MKTMAESKTLNEYPLYQVCPSSFIYEKDIHSQHSAKRLKNVYAFLQRLKTTECCCFHTYSVIFLTSGVNFKLWNLVLSDSRKVDPLLWQQLFLKMLRAGHVNQREGFTLHVQQKRKKRKNTNGVPTTQQLHPGAGLVNGGGVAEEEQCHAGDAAEDQHHGQQHEDRGCLEGSGRDGAEVGEAAHAGELPAGRRPGAHAVVEEAEVAGLWRVDAVADPVGLDEHHHVDDGEANGEDGPEHPDGTGVAHVIVMVNLGGFLGRQHVLCCFLCCSAALSSYKTNVCWFLQINTPRCRISSAPISSFLFACPLAIS